VLAELRRLEAKLAAVADMADCLDLLSAQASLAPAHLLPLAPGRGQATAEAGEAGQAGQAGGAGEASADTASADTASADTAGHALPVRVGWAGLQQAEDVEAEVAASAVRIRSCPLAFPLCCPATACRPVPCLPPLLSHI